MRSWDSSVV